MDTTLNQNESKLGVLVFPVPLKMLADTDGSLDEVVQIVWVLWRKTFCLENTQNLVACNPFDLCNAMPVSKHDTNLRGGLTLLGQFADLVYNIFS